MKKDISEYFTAIENQVMKNSDYLCKLLLQGNLNINANEMDIILKKIAADQLIVIKRAAVRHGYIHESLSHLKEKEIFNFEPTEAILKKADEAIKDMNSKYIAFIQPFLSGHDSDTENIN